MSDIMIANAYLIFAVLFKTKIVVIHTTEHNRKVIKKYLYNLLYFSIMFLIKLDNFSSIIPPRPCFIYLKHSRH